jgi:hypothetical protein
MKEKTRINILGAYDFVLALGAIFTGVIMISGKGIFAEYPKEWLSIFPFEGWAAPGIIGIMIFGLGNITAAIFSFKKEMNKGCLISAIMGDIFIIALVAQVIILKEIYLATVQFFILSLIQLFLCVFVYFGHPKGTGYVVR